MMALVCCYDFLVDHTFLNDFFFNNSCLVTNIALSNGYDMCYIGGSCIIQGWSGRIKIPATH